MLRLKASRLLATAGGIGYLPVAPGTWASFAAAGCWWWLPTQVLTQSTLVLALSAVGFWAAGEVVKDSGRRDPSCIVVDEWTGMWLALIAGPKSIPFVLVALALFRFFDIIKPLPIKYLERLPGAWGIMADDVVAGFLARISAGWLFVLFFR